MKFEEQMQEIADRDALHRFIDAQPEGAQVLVLVQPPADAADACARWAQYGTMTWERMNWLIDGFKVQVLFENLKD